MARKSNAVEPFKTLNDLYENIERLNLWPPIEKLRECAEYVYNGSELENPSPRKLSKLDRDGQPRTIVCHDMKGGYLQDRFIDGASEINPYAFYHWSLIDIFIYFSHYMITIPPLGWTNAAHKHGVKILGTLITEHKNGEKVWDEILQSLEETKKFADALVTLTKHYGFEGWLLNIENRIQVEHIEMLKFFIKYLTDNLHRDNKDAEIIWYDSVIMDGTLKWQNELNEKNQMFFDCCDGIFLNYNWDDTKLANSCERVAQNDRIRDIFVGLDVWGRGCPGGGGFNSLHALQKIRKFNLSVAIFAPGWTHEHFGPSTFGKVENIFWAQLAPLLYIHVPVYENEIFETSFCRGYGNCLYEFGMILQNQPFYNLARQKLQISVSDSNSKFINQIVLDDHRENNEIQQKELPANFLFETAREKFKIQNNKIIFLPKNSTTSLNSIEYSDKLAFHGGGCLRLFTKIGNQSYYHRLFLVHLEYSKDIDAILTYKPIPMIDSVRDNEDTGRSPILVLFNGDSYEYLQSDRTTNSHETWTECYYTVKLRTINEIGVVLSAGVEYYIGEIKFQSSHCFTSQDSQ